MTGGSEVDQPGSAPRAASATDAATALFSGHRTIVLVANSEEADIAALSARYGGEALFVFFNKVYKVLDRPFEGDALLVARSSPAGANIVYRREVEDVLRLLRSLRFKGIVNLKAGSAERFSPAEEFGDVPVAHLDLAPALAGFYPGSHVATSGFALALHLVEVLPRATIILAGFSAKRSERWKLFHDHDWTFEQIVLRLLVRSGRLVREPAAGEQTAGEAIARRFPQFSAAEISLAASDVLAERLETANLAIDGLMRVTRLQRRVEGWIRGLKPTTRKARLAREAGTDRPGGG